MTAIQGRRWAHWGVPAIAVVAVLMRLPYMAARAGSDEAGYLLVARAWHGSGTSLYGNYWVDRPPLLMFIFKLADLLGGMPGVRILGALAAGIAVLGAASVARQTFGTRAALITATVAAVLFSSPLMGTVQVNGEMYAAPFVAWALALTVHAIRAGKHAHLAAIGAGALAVGAILVKQNMVGPLIFFVIVALVSWRTNRFDAAHLRRIVAGAIAGGVAALAVVLGATVALGTSLSGVYDAVYPFRLRAADFLANWPDVGQHHRAFIMLDAVLASGTLVMGLAFGLAVVRRQLRGPVVWGVVGALTWAIVSICSGGGFWNHYLVELIVPLSIAGGLAFGEPSAASDGDTEQSKVRRRLVIPSVVTAWVVIVAVSQWITGISAPQSERASDTGLAIAAVSHPGDTMVTAFGSPDLLEASGLESPYPYLWTLIAQVEDKGLPRLTSLLASPQAPTWFISWDRHAFGPKVFSRVKLVVALRFHQVGVICGLPVYLRNDVVRAAPQDNRACTAPVVSAPR